MKIVYKPSNKSGNKSLKDVKMGEIFKFDSQPQHGPYLAVLDAWGDISYLNLSTLTTKRRMRLYHEKVSIIKDVELVIHA